MDYALIIDENAKTEDDLLQLILPRFIFEISTLFRFIKATIQIDEVKSALTEELIKHFEKIIVFQNLKNLIVDENHVIVNEEFIQILNLTFTLLNQIKETELISKLTLSIKKLESNILVYNDLINYKDRYNLNYLDYFPPDFFIDPEYYTNYCLKLPYSLNNETLSSILNDKYYNFLKYIFKSNCLKTYYLEVEKKEFSLSNDDNFDIFLRSIIYGPLTINISGVTDNSLLVFINNHNLQKSNIFTNDLYKAVIFIFNFSL
jgi:hypothetical protein